MLKSNIRHKPPRGRYFPWIRCTGRSGAAFVGRGNGVDNMKRALLGVFLASVTQAVVAQPVVNGLPVKFESKFDKQKNSGEALVSNPNGVEKSAGSNSSLFRATI